MSDQKKQEILNYLQSLSPSLISSDGLLNVSALKDALGEENIATSNTGYSLNFAGKSLARAKADEPTQKELRVEREQSKNFDSSENIIIRGDNIDALKILRNNYYGKVQMIYIDPPYNTNSANFVYNDSFKLSEQELIEKFAINEEAINFFENIFGSKTHSAWLFAMYPRIRLARDLLSDSGVMFISIDDNEQANLKLLCDEIFGERNFETAMIWRKTGVQSNTKRIQRLKVSHEYVLCYFKKKPTAELSKIKLLPQWKKEPQNHDDPRGPYIKGIISNIPEKSDPDKETYYSITTPSGKKYTREWHITREEYDELYRDNRLYFSKNGSGVPSKKIFLHEEQSYYFDSIVDRMGTSTSAKNELEDIFGNRDIFDTPKPAKLIKELIRSATGIGTNDIILDFFAGSGTTAQSVMELNKEDGGKRKFILVQWDEAIDSEDNKHTYKFCKKNKLPPVISSICIERVNRSGEKILKGMGTENPIDIGYKVFSLCDRPQLIEHDNNQLELKSHRQSILDTLYNLILTSGTGTLSDPVEEIETGLLYKVNEAYFVLGVCATNLEQFSNKRIFINGYGDFRLHEWFSIVGLDGALELSTVKVLY